MFQINNLKQAEIVIGVFMFMANSAFALEIKEIGSYKLGNGEGFAEMLRYHSNSKSLMVTSSETGTIERLSIQSVSNISKMNPLEDAPEPGEGPSKESRENGNYDVLFCANMIHISPWESSIALFSHANPTQHLILYGPFMNHGKHNSQGNAHFDVSLKARDPRWGIRDIQDLVPLANQNGFVLHKKHPMPANNFTLIWKRTE